MNICIVAFEYPPFPGGVGRAVERIARNLASDNLSIHVIAPGTLRLRDTVKPVCEEGVMVHRTFPSLAKYTGDPLELQAIGDYAIKLHREHNFDVIHGMFLIPAGLIGALVAKEINKPYIASIRGSDLEMVRYNATLFSSLRWVLKQASVVTSVTSELLEKAVQIANIEDGWVIPNAFDASLFDSVSLREIAQEQKRKYQRAIKKALRIRARQGPIIGTVGTLRHVKGFPFLLEAFKKLLIEYPNAHLLAVGGFNNWNDKLKVKQRIWALRLKQRVSITGQVPHPHVLAWMREMDFFAFPSLHEGSPNALLEAMACGLPIVASEVGGIRDIITHGKNGLLVPPASVEHLAKNLKLLVQDNKLKTQLCKSALNTVESRLSPKQETDKWIAVYNSVA